MATSSRKNKNKPLLLFIITITLVIFFAFIIYKIRHPSPPAIDTNSKKVQKISEKNTTPPTQYPVDEKNNSIIDTNSTTKNLQHEKQILTQCQKTSTNLVSFFTQLSEQDYIEAYEIRISTIDYINKIIIKLLNNPPIVANETEDLLNILKNGAHFYRILGSKDISLIKDILIYENEYIENIMASTHEWAISSEECPDSLIRFNFPIKKLYEYSAFFLNTLGGQSYLFRRESRTRVLIKYYSTLVLDRAIQAGQNKYDINIFHVLDSTMEDINDAEHLVHKKMYLSNISKIISKYNAKTSK